MLRRRLLALITALTCASVAHGADWHVQNAEPARARPMDLATTQTPSLDLVVAKAGAGGVTSAVLIDLQTGAILESHNPEINLPPASVTKVVTTLYAIETLGADYRFQTRVIATGPIVGGRVMGDVILVGGGDPALDSDELAAMAKSLRDKGAQSVEGRFLYYDAALPHLHEIDAGQPDNAGYNPGLSGLNLNFNRVFFEWDTGNGALDLSLQARARQHSPRVSAMHVEAVDRNAPIFDYSQLGGADHWSVSRAALKSPGGVWLPVRDSGAYAADVFHILARHFGTDLPRPVRIKHLPEGTTLARMERRSLSLVARGMLHFSTNVTAELLGLTATSAHHRPTSLADSAGHMRAWALARYNLANAEFHDHSGLSEHNRISAGEMARLVAKASREGALGGLLRRYAVPDAKTGKPVQRGAEVRAKTGTLNFVSGLSGVMTGTNGKSFAFAIFTADLEARARIDGTTSRPPGTKRFGSRARGLQRALLTRWLLAYGA